MSFNDLGLMPEILRVLNDKGYKEPSLIQAKAIPTVLAGDDVIACAQTGTGKTASFALPLIQMVVENNSKKKSFGFQKPQALILTPTRELACQVANNISTYSKYLQLKTLVIYGGVAMSPQTRSLKKGVDILVATPGRLLDHVRQHHVDLSSVECLVLDEADRMLDMGFINDIRKITEKCSRDRQNLLFSATFSSDIKRLAGELLNNPTLIEIPKNQEDEVLIEQLVHPVDKARKRELLSHLIHSQNMQQVLVFTKTKHGANNLAEALEDEGILSAAIHGNKSQGARHQALQAFKSGEVRVLVATDVAARGLDIVHLPWVINYEIPHTPEDYVHRIGRTGRAGSKGVAISLVCGEEHKLLLGIERLLKQKIPAVSIPNFEMTEKITNPPPQRRFNQQGRRPSFSRGGRPGGNGGGNSGGGFRSRNGSGGGGRNSSSASRPA